MEVGRFRWLDGLPWRLEHLFDPSAAAEQLAEMVAVLSEIDPASLPCGEPMVRPPLQAMDDRVRGAIDGARHLIDADAFLDGMGRSRRRAPPRRNDAAVPW